MDYHSSDGLPVWMAHLSNSLVSAPQTGLAHLPYWYLPQNGSSSLALLVSSPQTGLALRPCLCVSEPSACFHHQDATTCRQTGVAPTVFSSLVSAPRRVWLFCLTSFFLQLLAVCVAVRAYGWTRTQFWYFGQLGSLQMDSVTYR